MTAGGAKPRHIKRLEKLNRAPSGIPFVWFTRPMLDSYAWGALTIGARRVIDRVCLEHMENAGKENGKLKVTYDDFVKFGVRRSSALESIEIASALGFLDIIQRGGLSYGGAKFPSIYGLTWLPRSDLSPATNRWEHIREGEPKIIIANLRRQLAVKREPEKQAWKVREEERKAREDSGTISQDIEGSPGSVTGDDSHNSAFPSHTNGAGSSFGSVTGISLRSGTGEFLSMPFAAPDRLQ